MSTSTTKKAVLYRFDREPLRGFVDPQSFQTATGIELLSQHGSVSLIPYQEVKLVCFVKDFDGSPVQQEKRLFSSRPKALGLWVRAQFRDNDFQEGVLPADLLHLDEHGFMVVPPDPASNNQRMFLPRLALKELRVIGVIGVQKRGKAEAERQGRLFEDG